MADGRAWSLAHRTSVVVAFAILLALTAACTDDGDSEATDPTAAETSTLPSPPPPPTQFVDVAADAGLIANQRGPSITDACLLVDATAPPEALGDCQPQDMSGGVAVADYDNDGWPDLYLSQLGDTGRLYRNNGDGTFADVTAQAGVLGPSNGNGAGFVDIDNDGFDDLYVTTIAESRFYLFYNNGDGTFSEQAEQRGAALADEQLRGGMSIGFGDYDNDGYSDIFTTEWLDATQLPSSGGSTHARLLRNRGVSAPGSFEDMTVQAGVELGQKGEVVGVPYVAGELRDREAGLTFSFAPAFVDLDNDGWVDLAVVSDFNLSQLFWNNRDGTFTEGTDAAGVNQENNGMGSTFADVDGDGLLDWFVSAIFFEPTDEGRVANVAETTYTGNRLYKNNGDRTFSDVSEQYGVRDGVWGWGAAFADFDNSGSVDLFMTNGMRFDATDERVWKTNTLGRLWWNLGVTPWVEGAEGARLTSRAGGKGVALLDYDRDGDLDIVIANTAATPTLYRNDGPTESNVRVRVQGTTSNRNGLGAVVTLTQPDGTRQMQKIEMWTHFLGQSERVAHFGVGDLTSVDVEVYWPATGRRQTFEGVQAGTVVDAVEPAG